MTKEEIIDFLKFERGTTIKLVNTCLANQTNYFKQRIEAYNMAIEALEQVPCDDCISRHEVLDALNKHKYSKEFCEEHHIDWSINLETAHIAINDLLPATVKEKTGKWIDDEFGSKCSCCGIYTHLDKFDRPMKFKHCSICGARMVSE